MKMSLSKKLGARIKEIRESKLIKQVDLAEMISMEPSNLSKLENGNQFPKEENLERIAEALGVKVSNLFEFEHKKNKLELKDEVFELINSLSLSEIEFTYNFLLNLKLLKK